MMGNNILLICVIVLFGALIIRGYKKGFLRIVIYFAGIIAIIVISGRLSPYVSSFIINNTNTREQISDRITDAFKEFNSKYDNTVKTNQELTIRSYELPDVIKEALIENNTAQMYEMLLVSLFEEYVSSYLANKAINAMSFAAIFIVLIIAYKIILRIADLIAKIPIIKGVNKMAGALLGFLEALLIAWVAFFVMLMFIGGGLGDAMLAMIADSRLLSFLFNTNILFQIF